MVEHAIMLGAKPFLLPHQALHKEHTWYPCSVAFMYHAEKAAKMIAMATYLQRSEGTNEPNSFVPIKRLFSYKDSPSALIQ